LSHVSKSAAAPLLFHLGHFPSRLIHHTYKYSFPPAVLLGGFCGDSDCERLKINSIKISTHPSPLMINDSRKLTEKKAEKTQPGKLKRNLICRPHMYAWKPLVKANFLESSL